MNTVDQKTIRKITVHKGGTNEMLYEITLEARPRQGSLVLIVTDGNPRHATVSEIPLNELDAIFTPSESENNLERYLNNPPPAWDAPRGWAEVEADTELDVTASRLPR